MTRDLGAIKEKEKYLVDFFIEEKKKDIKYVETSCGCTSYSLKSLGLHTRLIVTYKAGRVPKHLQKVEIVKRITVYLKDLKKEEFKIKGKLIR